MGYFFQAQAFIRGRELFVIQISAGHSSSFSNSMVWLVTNKENNTKNKFESGKYFIGGVTLIEQQAHVCAP